jgi:predicted Holliday junction resolvase-like endonuclease
MKTKEAEFFEFVNGLSEFLAPRFAETINRLAYEFRKELEQKSKDEIVSRELQQLEPLFKDYKRTLEDAAMGIGPGHTAAKWKFENIIKTIKQLYTPKK